MFEKLMTNNIQQDRYDTAVFKELSKASGALQDVLSTPPIANEPWQAIVNDFWAGFYKFNPELVPEEKVNPLYRANRSFVEKFLEDPATAQTRIFTTLDELSAGMATISASQKLNEELNNRPDLKEKFDRFFKQCQSNPEGPDAETIQQIISDMQASARDIRRAVKTAIEAGQNEVENLNTNLKGWGLEPGDLKNVPIGQRLVLADRFAHNNRFKKLAEIIGRYRNLARSRQKGKIKSKRDDIHSITLGNDLTYTLPAELTTLNHPLLKLDFFRKYTESELLQYELKTKEPQGRGPMIAAVDVSLSMADDGKLDQAIAVAMSLVDTASRQKRPASLIFFNTAIVKEIEFLPKEKNVEKYLQIAEIGADGGTEYAPPLKRSLEIIQNKRYKEADLVFITDGLCKLEDVFLNQFLNQKKENGFKCFTVLIGLESSEVQRWSDQVWSVPNIDGATAGEIFEAVY